jgi:hypothetical protein
MVVYNDELDRLDYYNNTKWTQPISIEDTHNSTSQFITQNWTSQVVGGAGWTKLVWAAEINKFCAIAYNFGDDRVMTSPDGITWTDITVPLHTFWGLAWSPQLSMFCGVSATAFITSTDGVTWVENASLTVAGSYRAIAWAPELGIFCAVSDLSSVSMTSDDGTTWIAGVMENTRFQSVTWAPQLGLFCALSSQSNIAATSPDGLVWTSHTTILNNTWQGVAWAPQLAIFCAVANSSTGDLVMTSPDGINWDSHAGVGSKWRDVTWSSELCIFCAVGDGDAGSRAMTSTDGINWVLQKSSEDSSWISVVWASQLNKFCVVAFNGTNRIMTSSGNNLKCKNLAIGDSVTGNDSSAILDITSTTKGFLPPRMNTTQRDIINPAAQGLTIYNTTTDEADIYNGSAWVAISTRTHGSYNINATGTANTTTTANGIAYFMRIGNVISVSCKFDVNPAAINTVTSVTLSLPFARSGGNFSSVTQGSGNGTTAASFGNNNFAQISSTNLAETMTITFVSDGTAADKTWYCIFQYSQINT